MGTQLDAARGPDGGVVGVEEAFLVGVDVLRTLFPRRTGGKKGKKGQTVVERPVNTSF